MQKYSYHPTSQHCDLTGEVQLHVARIAKETATFQLFKTQKPSFSGAILHSFCIFFNRKSQIRGKLGIFYCNSLRSVRNLQLQNSSFFMQNSSFLIHNFWVFDTQFLVLNTNPSVLTHPASSVAACKIHHV